jgi:Zn-dependent membrane protease YugP
MKNFLKDIDRSKVQVLVLFIAVVVVAVSFTVMHLTYWLVTGQCIIDDMTLVLMGAIWFVAVMLFWMTVASCCIKAEKEVEYTQGDAIRIRRAHEESMAKINHDHECEMRKIRMNLPTIIVRVPTD